MRKIAVFASGRGSNFQAVFKKIEAGEIKAEISLLISNNPDAGAIEFARENNIPVKVVRPADFESALLFGNALLSSLKAYEIELIILAGYLKMIPPNVVEAFPHRMINVHPSLLPSFGGKGMYGMNVHRAVYKSGVKVSGITVHFVDEKYDTGPILLQQAVDISDCRSPEEIAERVLKEEHQQLPLAVKLLCERRVSVEEKRVLFGD